jgi:LCP family protein required for cell wall assembly
MRRLLLLLVLAAACVPVPQPSFDMQTVTAEALLTEQSGGVGGGGEPSFTPPPSTATITPEPFTRLVGLLLGEDQGRTRPEAPGYGIRTDAFIVVVLDYNSTRFDLTMISVPRDLFVSVPCEPGYPAGETPMNRVNAAWYRGGFECVASMVEDSFGLTVNAPMAVLDMTQYMALVDRMGGLEVTPDVTHSDPCGDTDPVWNAGQTYQFSGLEALCYVRGRRAYGGDLDRNRRVLEIVKAALTQWPAAILYDPSRAVDLYEQFVSGEAPGLFQTNADFFTEVLPLIELLPRLVSANIRFVHFGLEDVVFSKDELYGSILLPAVYLPRWFDCILDGGTEEFCRG